MIPSFEKFFLPSLQCFAQQNSCDGKLLQEHCIKELGLNEEDIRELIKSGRKTKLQDRISWTITYFYQACLIERLQRGVYRITQRGRDFLKSHPTDFGKEDLMQFKEFKKYASGNKTATAKIQEKEHTASSKTPSEILDEAYQEINKDLTQKLLDEVKRQSPQFFEQLVIHLLVNMGYGGSFEDAAKVTQYSHDDGIDGVIKEDKLGLDTIYIQAKRYTTQAVQKPDLQKFIGALVEHKATKGIFITTSSFSSGALETCKKAEHVKIILIDGLQLANFMIEYNVGVSTTQVYEIKRVDTDFFAEE